MSNDDERLMSFSEKQVHWGLRTFGRLTPDKCERIHEASLHILKRTGVRLYDDEALDLVQQAGAEVRDGNRVQMPASLVEEALSTAPSEVTLYNRYGEPVMPIRGHCSYFGPGSDLLYVIDHCTGERRRAVMQDVIDGITLCDALEHIDFAMSMFLPDDVEGEIADRYQMALMLQYTTKPIICVTYDASGWIDAVNMAESVVGGASALREKPLVACYANVTTGLRHNKESLRKLLISAEKGLPVLYCPSTSGGGLTAPITTAGNLATTNAGALAGLVISQLKQPGTPVIFPGSGGGAMDMRTLVSSYAQPDVKGVGESMAHYYALPMFTAGGTTDTKLLDQQSSIEATLTLVLEVLLGGQIVHDLGYLESGLTGSLTQLMICHEIVDWLKCLMKEIEISDETLALDLIEDIGPDGQYVDTDHTLEHFRGRWYPDLFERDTYDAWTADGGKTLAERAAERVEIILREHEPEPLSGEAEKALQIILQRARDGLH
jgi:trimethylamine--corrinoid protein Co-methyltransferase